MRAFPKDELKMLMGQRVSNCVSIYMPIHHAGAEISQNRIRLRNLLREAEDRLLASRLRQPEARALLEPAERLAENEAFWLQPGHGLALFLAPGLTRDYHLPVAFDELVYLAPRIYVRPLLPLLSRDEHFFILALSQNAVRLLRGTRYQIDEVELKEAPGSLAEALPTEAPGKQLQFRTAAPVASGRMTAQFYSSGEGADDAKLKISRYFHQVDRSVRETLAGEHVPLILAGVGYLLPIYREANKYPCLAREGIAGNPDLLDAAELHARACAIMQPSFRKKQGAAIAQYREVAPGRLGTNKIRLIIPAASRARVGVLFVAQHGWQWGRFDPEIGELQVRRKKAKPGDEDLLDVAAFHTLANGGEVYVVTADEMPEAAPLAATFRY